MKHLRAHYRAYFALLLLLLSAGAVYFRALPAVPAAAPVASPSAKPAAKPSAAPTPGPTPVKGAAAVYVGGSPALTLASPQDAYALLDWWLTEQSASVPAGERLLSATFERPVSVGGAPAGVSPVPLERAQELLRASGELCPVRCVTQTVSVEAVSFSSEETKDAHIASGARIVLQAGREGQRAVVTNTLYRNGKRQGVVNTSDTVTVQPLAQRVAVGTYQAKNADDGPNGPKAPKGFALALPVKGEFAKSKGKAPEFGLNIRAKVGAAVTAPTDGTVTFAGEWGSYGFVVEIDHGSGFVTRVAPVAGCTLHAGDTVQKGQKLGTLAEPVDVEDEAHLYFGLLVGGIPYSPKQYMG